MSAVLTQQVAPLTFSAALDHLFAECEAHEPPEIVTNLIVAVLQKPLKLCCWAGDGGPTIRTARIQPGFYASDLFVELVEAVRALQWERLANYDRRSTQMSKHLEDFLAIKQSISDAVNYAIQMKAQRDEALLRRMLPSWVSEVAEPTIIFARDYEILGLGPGNDPVGAMGRVFIDAEDFR